jgi:hypothetical protein
MWLCRSCGAHPCSARHIRVPPAPLSVRARLIRERSHFRCRGRLSGPGRQPDDSLRTSPPQSPHRRPLLRAFPGTTRPQGPYAMGKVLRAPLFHVKHGAVPVEDATAIYSLAPRSLIVSSRERRLPVLTGGGRHSDSRHTDPRPPPPAQAVTVRSRPASPSCPCHRYV